MRLMKQTFQVATPDDFESVIEAVLTAPAPRSGAQLVTLTGDLGAGKTTFTQQLAAHLGITEPITSPTFGIMKGYEIDGNEQYDQLIHIDAYRIEDIEEVGPLRLEEMFAHERTLICIEWPERIEEVLPTEHLDVVIEITDAETRSVRVTA